MARVAVVGAGVVGVSSAYLLAKAGHDVTLIDAAAEPGRGASAGNAAQLSWAYGDAMASPALLKHLPAIALGRDPAFRIRWHLDPDFLRWGLRFLVNASAARWWENTKALLELAAQSREELALLMAETDLAFDYRMAGKLHLFADTRSFSAARSGVSRKAAMGIDQRLLTRMEAEEIEPALERYQSDIAGAIHTPGDALGDAAAFCRQLTRHAVHETGVTAIFGHRATGLVRRNDRLTAIRFADREELRVDAAVICVGPQVAPFSSQLGEMRAIRTVRGYSLTVDRGFDAPLVSLTDVKRKLAFVSVGERYRVAGLADIEGSRSHGFETSRFDALHAAASAVLPDVFRDAKNPQTWSGERPMTPTSRPIIGPSRKMAGVFINAGHGMLGWTLALGSARRIVDLLK